MREEPSLGRLAAGERAVKQVGRQAGRQAGRQTRP